MTVIARFEIKCSRFVGPTGELAAELPGFAHDRALMTELYRWLVLARSFDAKAVALQRTGRLGTYASSLGQEAVGVGLAHAMKAEDVLLPSFREHAAQLVRGVMPEELFAYWGGDERGSDFAGPRRDFPVCIPVGTHAPHAAGVALAMKLRGEDAAAVCVFGDGATSKGDVYEAMNVAGAWRLPVLFVACNNQWAISVPRSSQTAAETLAQKAIAAGFPGVQVDGNDVVAVRHAAAEALARARAGEGPTLIEAVTYRLADHTTVDDASRYRDDAEVGHAWKFEPIVRLRRYLTDHLDWTKREEEALIVKCTAVVEAAAQAWLAMEAEPPEAIFNYLYDAPPAEIARQRTELMDGV